MLEFQAYLEVFLQLQRKVCTAYIHYNYKQLLHKEAKGILFYQGFPRQILRTKTSRVQRLMFCRKNWSKKYFNFKIKFFLKNFNFPKKFIVF